MLRNGRIPNHLKNMRKILNYACFKGAASFFHFHNYLGAVVCSGTTVLYCSVVNYYQKKRKTFLTSSWQISKRVTFKMLHIRSSLIANTNLTFTFSDFNFFKSFESSLSIHVRKPLLIRRGQSSQIPCPLLLRVALTVLP